MPFLQHGFLRVAAAVPRIRVADPAGNAEEVRRLLRRAEADHVDLTLFPELCLTGYTCGDLFHQPTLWHAASEALAAVAEFTKAHYRGLALVGLPVQHEGRLFNCAAVLLGGKVLAVVPKRHLPNYKEFYEARHFQPGSVLAGPASLSLAGQETRLVPEGLLSCANVPGLRLGIEICEDLWVPQPPSSQQAVAGATILCNLSASNDLIGKADYRRQLVVGQSGRCLAGYVYASCGLGESTTDVVYGGHCLIAENGVLLAESARFEREPSLLVAEIDLDRLLHDRVQQGTFGLGQSPDSGEMFFLPAVPAANADLRLRRTVDAHPFVPKDASRRAERCAEIFHLQVAGLAQRLEVAQPATLTLGVSGGLDSTLALLVACKTLDLLGRPRHDLLGLTLPGFGTTRRTLENARVLLRHLGVSWQEIDIRGICLEQMRLQEHRPFGIDLSGLDEDGLVAELRKLPPERRQDLVFENVQARMRTSLLMNRGFVVGTGDLSELAVGWCTYNADQMSMYNPNVGVPKTLVQWLVAHVAEHDFQGPVQQALRDIVGTEISPELLPLAADGSGLQKTEAAIGPYELIDFFLYHFHRFGTRPAKLLYLARQAAFSRAYSEAELRQWLKSFLRRFFSQQFKRSALPDGPKVGTVSLSPRGDWRMPSDASAEAWLAEAERL